MIFINLSWIFKKIHCFALFSSIKTLLELAGYPTVSKTGKGCSKTWKDILKQENDVLKEKKDNPKQEKTF